jgi:flavodoxin
MTVKVAVIYYSATGTVHALAEALAQARGRRGRVGVRSLAR